jgi:hypothetical protein
MKSDPCKCFSLTSVDLENPQNHNVTLMLNSYQKGETTGWFSYLMKCNVCNREWRESFYSSGVFV